VDQRRTPKAGQTLRLAAAGEMAGAIAHEINQPLTAVTNYGRSAQMLLERDHAGPPQVRDIILKVLTEAERAAEVVRRLRDFFRAGTTRLEVVSLEDLPGGAAWRSYRSQSDCVRIRIPIGTATIHRPGR
jgi:C4-dicarboxylate-specific signal transduction histidine kinase